MDPEVFKERDAASYDSAAESYGEHIERLGGPLADHLCGLAHLSPGDDVLDVGCGTGVAARCASARVGARGHVVGVDLSGGMIATARRASPDIEFRVMDAESLQFRTASFDALISLCAVLHFPSISTAVAEMHRVLRPAGRLAVAFGHPRPISAWGIAKRAFARVSARGPRLVAPGALRELAPAYLPWTNDDEGIHSDWARRRPVRRLAIELRRAGFEDVKVSWMRHEVRFESPVEFWEAQEAIDTQVRRRADAASKQAVDALRTEFIRRSESVVARGGTLVYPYQAAFFAARRRSRQP